MQEVKVMKKTWEYPEVKGMGVEKKKESRKVVGYQLISLSTAESKIVKFKCLGIFDEVTKVTI